MYKENANLIQPENENIKIWRYLDFTKFVSLIDTRRLYFARADKLEDPFEGSWPKNNVNGRNNIPEDLSKKKQQKFIEFMRFKGEVHKELPRYVAINCWHMNEYESAAMWKLYLKSNEGIAIQSSYASLKKSLIDDEDILVGMVKYLDYDSDFISSCNTITPFIHKRKSFEHEQEIRALVIKWPVGDNGIDLSTDTIEYGLEIKADIERLIERIYISPTAPAWFADLVRAVITRYGYNFEVVHSMLNENPVF